MGAVAVFSVRECDVGRKVVDQLLATLVSAGCGDAEAVSGASGANIEVAPAAATGQKLTFRVTLVVSAQSFTRNP